jgi:hypothetical protein
MKNPVALFGPQWIAKTATLVVVVAGAAAIAVANIPAPANHTLTHLPAKDVASWAMPLDRYLPVDTHKQDYATDLLIGKCLAAKGFDWGVPWQGPLAFTRGPVEPLDQPLGVAVPAARAYHGPAEDDLSTYLWRKFVTQPRLTKTQDALWNSCFYGLRKTQPAIFLSNDASGASESASTLATTLTNEAYEAAGRQPEVVAAAARWRSCLAPAYEKALTPAHPEPNEPTRSFTPPKSPAGMPTTAVSQRFTTGVPSSPVSTTESTLAAQDLACQASSGYRSALYAAEYRPQTRVTADDAATLARATVDQRTYDRTLDRAIAADLPAKPAS